MAYRKVSDRTPPGIPITYYSANIAKLSSIGLPKIGLVGAWQSDVGIELDTTGGMTTIAGIIDSSNISQSGTNNAIQPTKQIQPQLINNVLNGLPIIRFNGSNSFLKTNGASYAAKMIIAVFRQNNFSDYGAVLAARSGTNANKTLASNEEIGFEGIPGSLNIFSLGSSSALFINGITQNTSNYNSFSFGAPVPNNTNFHLIEHIQNSSVSGQKYWMLGTDPFSSGRYFNGDLAMIAIYNVNDDTTRLAVRTYAKEKYNLMF